MNKDTSQPREQARQPREALEAITNRLAHAYRICCGLAPKQAVGELLDTAINMPEWEVVRAALASPVAAPEAPTATDFNGDALYSAWHKVGADVAGLRFADFIAALDAEPAATTASASSQEHCDSAHAEKGFPCICATEQDRAPAPSRNAAPTIKPWRDRLEESIGVQPAMHYADAEIAELRAALTQQSAAEAPIRQVQQIGFPSAWCDVSEAEFVACSTEKRTVYRAAQAAHAGADTERDAKDAARWRFWRARAGFSSFPEKPAPALSFCSLEAPSHDMDETMFGEDFMEEVDRVTDEALAATEKKEQK